MEGSVIRNTTTFRPEQGDLCITMDDNDLVRLIQIAKDMNWQLGDELGIISYNEIPLKNIVAEGITTISPDFRQMGISMADMVLQGHKKHIENPFLFIERASF